jgi:Ca2+-transporting ATPase
MTTSPPAWHTLPPADVAARLDAAPDHGLSTAEAAARLARYGPNELREAPGPTLLARLWEQLRSFVVAILVVAAALSALLGDWIEALVILGIVVLNAALGVIQEARAEEALAALKKMAAPEARVLRDGHRVAVPARELAPGDVVFLEAGSFVPADLRLFESANLRADEAPFTGESVPVTKRAEENVPAAAPLGDRRNMAFMGTTITYGRGAGLVVATGMETQIGQIAQMLESYEEGQTPLQLKLDELGRTLGSATLVVAALVFLVTVVRDTSLPLLAASGPSAYFDRYGAALSELFLVAISLAIAAVPEGLPAIVTISLALGMREMVRRNALVRRLPAVETLGATTAICSDKTGTLTQNEMTAVQLHTTQHHILVTGEGYRPHGEFLEDGQPVEPATLASVHLLLQAAMLANDARLERVADAGDDYQLVGDPTEGALVVAAAKAALWREELERAWPRVGEVPFDSERKRMTTLHERQGADIDPDEPVLRGAPYVAFVKGAPDLLLRLCTQAYEVDHVVPLTPARAQHWKNVTGDLSRKALRVLAVAMRPLDALPAEITPEAVERDLIMLGLVAMRDPARPEVKPAIAIARAAGIRTIMVTGDYADTARAIAAEIGLLREGGEVLTGAQVDALDDAALATALERTDVFARTSPQHKVRIVEALRAHGHVVAMTGDGVNDAPALKRADIGVAMGITGTDVAKGVADIVLTDDNYVSIVGAVEQGRIIYSNIRKFVFYLLSCNVAEIAVIFLSALAGLPAPLTAIQLLWLNLVSDGAPALALGTERGEPDIMQRPPRPPHEPIVDRKMIAAIGVQTVAITAAVLGAYWLAREVLHADLTLARTMAFVTLSGSELLRAYTSRSERLPLVRIGLFGNRVMQYAVLASALLIVAVVYLPFLNRPFDTTPLGWNELRIVLPLMLVPAVAAEVGKWVRSRGTTIPSTVYV